MIINIMHICSCIFMFRNSHIVISVFYNFLIEHLCSFLYYNIALILTMCNNKGVMMRNGVITWPKRIKIL